MSLLWLILKRFVQSLQVGVSRHATNSHQRNASRFRFISFCYFNKNICKRFFLSYVVLLAADWITQRAYFLRRMFVCVGENPDFSQLYFLLVRYTLFTDCRLFSAFAWKRSLRYGLFRPIVLHLQVLHRSFDKLPRNFSRLFIYELLFKYLRCTLKLGLKCDRMGM